MNRELWTTSLTKNWIPEWPCPTCGTGKLRLVQNSLVEKETASSSSSRGLDDWDPDWISYTFSAWGKCTHATCGEQVAILGTGGVQPGWSYYDDDQPVVTDVDYFTPKFCIPMPEMIAIPIKCPDSVKEELRAAFALFWSDSSATANHVRVALERLLDHLGVPTRRRDSSKRMIDLSLHGRIEFFAAKQPSVGSQLMALKWLGNAGSHGSKVNPADILDAFEVLEHALVEIIDERSKKVAKLAQQLTKRHAPKRKYRRHP